jgi:hypothetical protein
VLVETVIFRLGLFGSGGNAGYLLPVAGFAAVAAALAADRILTASPRRWIGVVASMLVIATAGYALRTHPARADPVARSMNSAVGFLKARRANLGAVTVTHVWFFEMSGTPVPAGDAFRSPWSHPTHPGRLALGSLVVWDCSYSDRFGLRWRRLLHSGFAELARFGGGRVVVLRRVARHGTGGAARGVTIKRPRCL